MNLPGKSLQINNEIKFSPNGLIYISTILGGIDESNVARLYSEIQNIIQTNARFLILDFSNVPYIDGAPLGFILKTVMENKVNIALVKFPPREVTLWLTLGLLENIDVTSKVSFYESTNDALNSFLDIQEKQKSSISEQAKHISRSSSKINLREAVFFILITVLLLVIILFVEKLQ